MLVSFIGGLAISGSMTAASERSRSGEPRLRSSTARRGTLRAVQLLLGHAKIETTVRYLGVEADDALRLAEQIEHQKPDAGSKVGSARGGEGAVAERAAGGGRSAGDGGAAGEPVGRDKEGRRTLRPAHLVAILFSRKGRRRAVGGFPLTIGEASVFNDGRG